MYNPSMAQQRRRNSKAVNATPKQQAMASVLANGGITNADAYREVTKTTAGGATVASGAYHMTSRPHAQSMIDAIFHEALSKAPRSAAETRAMLVHQLELHAFAEPSAVTLKAIDMYGRIPQIDIWQEHGRSDDGDASSDTIREKLRAKLAGLLSAPAPGDTVVDVVAEVDEQPNGIR